MFVDFSGIDFDNYDVIIAGSGPAGASLALQLEKNNKSVLLFETGLIDYDSDVQDLFNAIKGRGHYAGRHWGTHWIRAFGGTSAVWAGWCLPLTQRNMKSWPLTRNDLEPYYVAATEFLHIDPVILNFQAPFMTGFDYRPFSVRQPIRVSVDYAEAFESSNSIHVVLGVSITNLLANEGRTRVTGFTAVPLSNDARQVNLRPAQHLVLAAGGMGNAQILLNSQSGSDVAIGNENDQVGRFLMEHPHNYNCGRTVMPATFRLPARPAKFGEHMDAIVPSDALFEQMGEIDVSFSMNEVDINTDDNIESYVANQLMGGDATAFNITARAEMSPDSNNRVELTSGKDPAGLSLLKTTCVVSADTMLTVDNYLRIMGQNLADSGQGRLRIDNDALYFRIEGGGHTMGTTRMGENARSSVVDGNCRVHGYDNLYVAGSSVFTTGGFANPTLTIVALATRLGDHLADLA